MDLSNVTNDVVHRALSALDEGNKEVWQALFARDASMTDDGHPRSLDEFTQQSVGQERFVSIDTVEQDSLRITGLFDAGQWGQFPVFFQFHLNEEGKIKQLDIGQV